MAEGEAGGPAERGRACARVYRLGSRAGAGSRQAASMAQRGRRIQIGELKEHVHQEKLGELEQTATTEELHCVRRGYCQQRSVVPARSIDGYVEEAAAPRGGDDMATYREERYGDGGLLSGVVLARPHPSSTLYFGIVLCTLINKAWFTYKEKVWHW